MSKIKIVREVAEKEFHRFCEDMAVKQLDTDDFNDLKGVVVESVMHGHLVFNDDSEPVYTPWRKNSEYKEPITFHERRGRDSIAMDNKGKHSTAKQAHAMMGSMCRIESKIFGGLVGPDLKTCEAIFMLLAV